MAKAILYTPHPNQRKIHQSINSEPYKYYTINIGRQFGKTLLAINQKLYWALNNQNVNIGWVSPVFSQSKKVFRDTVKAFRKRPEIYKRKPNESELRIEFVTGSTIQYFSGEQRDSIRGNTFDYLICDEFAFMQPDLWNEILRATTLVKGKKVLLISTPRGKNHFYKFHQLDGVNPRYKSFTMTSYDNPTIDPKEIDDARSTLPDLIFRQEYLAEFVDGGSSLFKDLMYVEAQSTEDNYAGIDVGRADDYTVLTIYNSEGKQFYCERWRQMDWAVIVRNIRDALIQNKVREADIEVNSIGDAVYEMLRNEMGGAPVNINPFVTTSKSKQDIIEQLMVANQNREITIMPHDWLKKEFDVFTYEYNAKSRSIKYSAPSGFHDDGVMSSAIGYNCYKRMGKGSWGNVVF